MHPERPDGPGAATVTDVVFLDQCNGHGTLFAGAALALMSRAAWIAAARAAGGPVVMARLERNDFLRPVLPGEIVEIAARVTRVGTASMTVDLLASAAPAGAPTTPFARGACIMVAVDAGGRPRPVASRPSETH
ncbi:MAG: acyl-CoA thioesterase [Gemmobacter sp.]